MERNLSRRCAPLSVCLFSSGGKRYNTSIRIHALGKGENIFAEISSDHSLAGINLAYYTLGYGLCHPLNACFLVQGSFPMFLWALCVFMGYWRYGKWYAEECGGTCCAIQTQMGATGCGCSAARRFCFLTLQHAAVHNPYAVWRAAAPLWCAEFFVAADAERGAGCACSV